MTKNMREEIKIPNATKHERKDENTRDDRKYEMKNIRKNYTI